VRAILAQVWRVRPELAATELARRPYDLRHADLSLWLNASGAPAEIAARARTSARVLPDVHLHCTDGQDDLVSQRIEDAVDSDGRLPQQCVKASGYVHRRQRPDPVRLPVSPRDHKWVLRWPVYRFGACFIVLPCP
jgi:hypothetical protein